jgi:RNA polymerase sigma factor (sigma-70 family)
VAQLEAEQRSAGPAAEEAELVRRLRAGDERAFESLVDSYQGRMLAVARTYVKTRAVAEEVVQEAWLAVLNGLDRFEGRSSLKTWIFSILVNTAMTRGGREARSVPFSSLAPAEGEAPAVEPERFRPTGAAFAGHWQRYPGDWSTLPEEGLLGRARRRQGSDRGAPGCAADGDRDARHRGLQRGRGLRRAGGLGRQPAGIAAPRALAREGGAREAPRWLSRRTTSAARRWSSS